MIFVSWIAIKVPVLGEIMSLSIGMLPEFCETFDPWVLSENASSEMHNTLKI